MNTLQFASRARVIQSRQEMRVEAVKVRWQRLLRNTGGSGGGQQRQKPGLQQLESSGVALIHCRAAAHRC